MCFLIGVQSNSSGLLGILYTDLFYLSVSVCILALFLQVRSEGEIESLLTTATLVTCGRAGP